MTTPRSVSCPIRICAVVPLMFGALVWPAETVEAQARRALSPGGGTQPIT